jgi:uncharacterized protein
MKLSSENINIIKNYFATKPVKKAFLFGSYAREDASEKSDIDILVELDYQKGIAFQFIEMQNYLNDTFDQKVDLVSAEGLSANILPFINQDKQLIYER